MRIPLKRRGAPPIQFAEIDPIDAPLVWDRVWRADNARYKGEVVAERACSGTWPNVVYMHRLIMGAHAELEVDHIDGDGLNNRRSNLRVVTHAENMQNKRPYSNGSGIRGVFKSGDRWRAGARLNGRSIKLGTFATAEEAGQVAAAWREANMPFSTPR